VSEGIGFGPAAVGAIAFLLLAVWCFTHRRIDRSLAALGLYLGLFDGYLKLKTGSPLMTLARDVLVVAIAGGALLRAITSQRPLPLPPLGGLVLAFSAVVVVELFNPQGPGPVFGLGGVRQHVEFVPLFFLGYAFMRRETQIQKLIFILVVCAAAGGVVSYIQSTLSPQELADWGPGYSERILGTGAFEGAPRITFDENGVPSSVRPFGLGSDLGAGAVAAALALPALIAMMMAAEGTARVALLPFAIGIGLAIVTSGTRTALITVFVTMIAFGLIAAASRNGLRVMAGLAVTAILVYAAFGVLGEDNSTTSRAKTITPGNALSTFTQERAASVAKFGEYATTYPFGLGVGTVGPAAGALSDRPIATQTLNTETEWNFLVLEIGLLGLLLFLALNFRLMALALRRIRRLANPTMRLQLAALAAPLFGLVVAGFGGTTTATVPPAPYFWFVAGLLSYWLVTHREEPASPRARREPRAAPRSPVRAREPVLRSSAERRG